MAQTSTAGVQKALGGIDYPASKQDLLNHAKNSSDSDDEVLDILNQLPDREYDSPADVNKEVGKVK